jgi:ABC-type multidrug transport system fused ATPase/permease subunit
MEGATILDNSLDGCDRVAVMEEGCVVELGSFEELVEKRGVLHGPLHGRV